MEALAAVDANLSVTVAANQLHAQCVVSAFARSDRAARGLPVAGAARIATWTVLRPRQTRCMPITSPHPPSLAGLALHRHDIVLGGRCWQIDAVRDQSALLAASDRFADFPFGLLLWESSIALARALTAMPAAHGLRVLEIGRGGRRQRPPNRPPRRSDCSLPSQRRAQLRHRRRMRARRLDGLARRHSLRSRHRRRRALRLRSACAGQRHSRA